MDLDGSGRFLRRQYADVEFGQAVYVREVIESGVVVSA